MIAFEVNNVTGLEAIILRYDKDGRKAGVTKLADASHLARFLGGKARASAVIVQKGISML